jgi:zinc transport system ATP-binding protein
MIFTPVDGPHTHVDSHSQLGMHERADVVCVHDVSFAYGPKPALSHITLHVKEGSTLGIIGPNGGGKSTLLKLMLGVLTPDAGSITILGKAPKEACAAGGLVGYVPQRHSIDWSFPITVKQVTQLGLIGRKKSFRWFNRADHDAAMAALEATGMARHAEQPIGGLSGGQQQRVFIARALISRPKILFLDEPTTGVDQAGQERFLQLLDSLKKQFGLTLVMVSHDLRSVVAVCDAVACLNKTLHYHDRPQGLSQDVLFKVFQCDMDAVLDTHSGAHDGSCCGHTANHVGACCHEEHSHSNPLAPVKR